MKTSGSESTIAETNMIASNNDELMSQQAFSNDEFPLSIEQAPLQINHIKQRPTTPVQNHTEVMLQRWKAYVEYNLPSIDLIDLSNEKD